MSVLDLEKRTLWAPAYQVRQPTELGWCGYRGLGCSGSGWGGGCNVDMVRVGNDIIGVNCGTSGCDYRLEAF